MQLVVHQDYHALGLGSRYAVGVAPKHFVVDQQEYATIRNAVRIRYGKTRIRYGKTRIRK